MRRGLFAAVLLLVCWQACPAASVSAGTLQQDQAPPAGSVLSLDAYRAELGRMDRELDSLAVRPQSAVTVRDSLPRTWMVDSRGAESESGRAQGSAPAITVSTGFLRDGLSDFLKAKPEQKPWVLEQLRTRLKAMEEEARNLPRSSAADAAMRRRLAQILATREFSAVRGPTLLEVWWDRTWEWLKRWLGKLGDKIPNIPMLGLILVWVVIGGTAMALAIWLYRLAVRGREIEPDDAGLGSRPARSWAAWMAEARAQAARDNWREAIRFGYWAALSYLESAGVWIPDRARTPRDCLRALPGDSPHRPAFAALTRSFETTWYGNRAAGQPEFDEMLARLEQLGCA
jgi:hypothetical protein